MNEKLTIGSCFSGIGGLELGLEWTGGFETKWQIENDEYATKILEKHWPNVKRYSDIRDVSFPDRVDVICGGFPCQDVSIAGKRLGEKGTRTTLWKEMFRIIRQVGPRWVVAENVRGLLSANDGRFFGTILRDLADGGYNAEWNCFSASSFGAPHRRERIFIIAYPNCNGLEKDTDKEVLCNASYYKRNDGHVAAIHCSTEWLRTRPIGARSMGVGNGVSSDIHRLKCLGNAVVPQVAQKIGEMILSYEKTRE